MSSPSLCLVRFRPFQLAHRPSWRLSSGIVFLLGLMLFVGGATETAAQGSQLKPPSQMQSSGQWQQQQPSNMPLTGPTQLSPPNTAAPTQTNPISAQGSLSGSQAAKPPSTVVLKRFQSVTINEKVVDLRTLPDSTVLKGKSGRTITVARIKQLQARIDGASGTPMIMAQRGQSIKSLAAAPAGTLVTLPGGRVTRSQDLAKIQTVFAKLSVKRTVQPIPMQPRNATATAVVGQGITLAEAMKRPGADVIQIGAHKYTADQLRQMDTLLKASLREPRGLLERASSRSSGNSSTIRKRGEK